MTSVTLSLYDLFSYILSGFLSVLIWYCRDILDIRTIINQLFIRLDFIPLLIVSITICYLVGQVISILSSLIIEKWVCSKSEHYKNRWTLENILGIPFAIELQSKFKRLVHVDYNSKCNFRYLICYVQENCPNVYSTAFIFLSFYGMARNIALIGVFEVIIQIAIIIEDFKCMTFLLFLCEAVLTVIFFIGYIKFRTYFTSQIYHGFMLEKNEGNIQNV